MSRQINNSSLSQGTFLLGFIPFFDKELKEWKRKKVAIAILMLIPLLTAIVTTVSTNFIVSQTGKPLPPIDLTQVASTYGVNSFWLLPVTILLSTGLISREVDAGTIYWNLSKPLSRNAFLLNKWLVTTLMTWFIAVIIANIISLFIAIASLKYTPLRLNEVIAANLAGLCCIAFWVLVCILLSMLVKDQSSVTTGALMLAVGGFVITTLPNKDVKLMAPFYPSNTVDWLVTAPNIPKAIAYFIYVIAMVIITKLLFDDKEF
jgi:ABC-2 type transport system permease protein